jgi:hypothetical protein
MQTDLKARFTQLAKRDKQFVLAKLISNLTIASRAAYDSAESQRFERMRAINEGIHTASNQLEAMLAEDSRHYPDDVFVQILFERIGAELETEAISALEGALKTHTLST